MGVPFKNSFTMTRGLAKADGPRNYAPIEPLRKIVFHFLHDFAGQVGSPVVHGHQDAFDFKAWIDAGVADLL